MPRGGGGVTPRRDVITQNGLKTNNAVRGQTRRKQTTSHLEKLVRRAAKALCGEPSVHRRARERAKTRPLPPNLRARAKVSTRPRGSSAAVCVWKQPAFAAAHFSSSALGVRCSTLSADESRPVFLGLDKEETKLRWSTGVSYWLLQARPT